MSPELEIAVYRARREAAARVPSLKREKAEYQLERELMPSIYHKQRPFPLALAFVSGLVGWGLIYLIWSVL